MSDIRYCPNCGAQVSAQERFCPNCGTRMADQQPPPPAATPTIPIGQLDAGSAKPPPTAPPTYQAPFGVPPAPAAPPKRRGLPIFLLILAGVGVLCVFMAIAVIGILTLLGSRVSSVFSEINSGLTTTVEARPSAQGGGIVPMPTQESIPTIPSLDDLPTVPPVVPTSTSGGGIVGGGVVPGGGASQVQTAEAQAAAQQTATAAIAEAEAIIASGKQIFHDEFVDNRNSWFTGVFEQKETDKIEGGVFKVIWSDEGTSYELYEVRELTNFAAEVDCLVYQGGTDGSCGLVFSQKTDVGFYKFEVFEDYYRLFIVAKDKDAQLLAEGNPGDLITLGTPYKLRVIKRGDEIRLFINGVALDTVRDSTFPSGKVGVTTNSYKPASPIEVWFDNFTIWEL